MVFLRLFYHHMVGDLRGHKLFKSRLYMYLDGQFIVSTIRKCCVLLAV